MKNKFSIFALILLFLMISSCEESSKNKEQSILFHDDYLKSYVVSALNKKEIEYRLEGNSIWYLVEHKDEVKSIYEDALLNRPIEYKFYDAEKQKRFVGLLEDKGVHPMMKSDRAGIVYVYIPKKSREVAEKIFNQIITN